MESAKDFGFNEGYILENGALVPADHTEINSVNKDKKLVIPNVLLHEEESSFNKALGKSPTPFAPAGAMQTKDFGKAYGAAKALLNITGITKSPTPQDVTVGFDFRGDKVYSNPQLANNTDKGVGYKTTESAGVALGAMGAFKDHNETSRFISIGAMASDESFHKELDDLRNKQDPRAFIATMNKVNVGPVDTSKTEFSAYKMYENWNNMSPAQKSLAITGVGVQGFKFDNGDNFETKTLNTPVKGSPSLSAAEGLDLASKGINVAPAPRNWAQLALIQDTIFPAKKSADIVNTANSLALLGYGQDGTAVPVNDSNMAKYDMVPAINYGVGAVTIPAGQGVPTGYTAVRNLGGRQLVVPTANKDTVSANTPDISADSAFQIYNKWPKATNEPYKATKGGSALIAGLSAMGTTNPYTLGAMMANATYEHVSPKGSGDLAYNTEAAGITLSRLTKGEVSKSVDSKGMEHSVDGEFNEENFGSAMKNLRGEFSKQGISSREIGYQLSNQAYAEGRLNEAQLVAAQRNLDMVFNDDGFILASKLSTGRHKGLEITERRRG